MVKSDRLTPLAAHGLSIPPHHTPARSAAPAQGWQMVPAWYCAKSCGRDTRAQLYLDRRGLRTFRPERHRYSYKTGREVMRKASLFPGYVFAWIESKDDLAGAVDAIGVAYVLGSRVEGSPDRRPAPMPGEWIDALMEAGPLVEGRKATLKVGQSVRIAIGRLNSVISRIDSIDNHGNVCVQMQMLGSVHQVKVPASLVQVQDRGDA